MITLVLCVYTAIHLNIPSKDDSQATVFLRKAKWVLIAIFAPELVVYVAWSQRQKVKGIHTTILKRHKDLVGYALQALS